MKTDSIQDSTRYVVADIHKGSIMPGNRAEMWRSIYLEPGARIYGGVWGGEIQITGGNILIEKSVYARGSITLTTEDDKSAKEYLDNNEEVEFNSVVVSPESLLIKENAPRARFNSDIYVGQLNLRNAIVYGNIYASNAKIENSIILGGVYCRKKLELTNSIVFMFKTKTLKLNENVSLLAPYSISEEEFEIEFPVKALTFYNLLTKKTNGSSGAVSLDEDDIFRVKYNETETTDADDTGFSLPSKVYILSVIERILNSTTIIEQFRKNKEMVEFLAFGNNIVDEFNEKFKDFTKNEIETALWRIIQEGIIEKDLDGGSKFNELVNLFKSAEDDIINEFKKINNDEKQKTLSNIENNGTLGDEVSQSLKVNTDEHPSEKNPGEKSQETVKCKNCGAIMNQNMKFCTQCGAKLH